MTTYLIIAGTSDIGTAVIEKLLSENHQVFATGRDASALDLLSKRYSLPVALLDAANFSAVDNVFKEAKETLGSLYGVVNCAGSLLLKPAHLTQQDQYQSIIEANLTTSFAVVHAAGKHLAESGGTVVLVSSAASMVGIPNHEAIAAAKAGINGLIRSAAATYAGNHLRFNAVAPGLVETKLTINISENPVARKASEGMHALGRLGKPTDIASAIVFFLQPENDWITGQVLSVDGGLSYVRPKMKL